MIITLDGPCGSGKSTLAQLLAQRLGFFYINSGYLYRSLAHLLVVEFGYDEARLHAPDNDHIAMILHQDDFVYHYKDGIAQIFYRGHEITHHLKSSTVSHHASIVSAYGHVRHCVAALQQQFGKTHDLVTDGRDCGTEIYPQAEFKFYVTAAPEIRAARLQADLIIKGHHTSFDEVLKMTIARDERDMTRANCPLKQAEDAILIDSSNQSIDQILEQLLMIVKK